MVDDWQEIRSWRKAQRAELIARRLAVPDGQRRAFNTAITAHIEAGFTLLRRMTVGFCWPFKGEFDARFALRTFRERGATLALPVVVAKAGPLQFRQWWPGAPMSKGVYDIPIPADTEIVRPQAAIVPMNGFDARGYRLGYGGGYFDRTLAALLPRPLAIGVAFECARVESIHPQAHDIAMDFVVTEAGIHEVTGEGLRAADAMRCNQRCIELCAARGLPGSDARQTGGFASPPCYACDFPGYFGEGPNDGS